MIQIPDWISQPLNKIRISHFRLFYVHMSKVQGLGSEIELPIRFVHEKK